MNTNWKSLGWTVTRKLVYYALVVFSAVVLGTWAAAAMTTASTFTFLLGLILAALTVGGVFTLAIREILYYCNKL
jgi:hypothetical protein